MARRWKFISECFPTISIKYLLNAFEVFVEISLSVGLPRPSIDLLWWFSELQSRSEEWMTCGSRSYLILCLKWLIPITYRLLGLFSKCSSKEDFGVKIYKWKNKFIVSNKWCRRVLKWWVTWGHWYCCFCGILTQTTLPHKLNDGAKGGRYLMFFRGSSSSKEICFKITQFTAHYLIP